jgi:hypothetical protein
MEDNDPNPLSTKYAEILVSPWSGGEHPTLPLFPPGFLYRDRVGLSYRIIQGVVEETVLQGDDGNTDPLDSPQTTVWVYRYIAVIELNSP